MHRRDSRRQVRSQAEATPLLKHLPISPLILLPTNLNRLIPSPHRLNKLLILRTARIQLLKLIALIIGRNIKGRLRVLTAHKERTLDDAVVCDAVDAAGTEDEFATGFQTGEEASDQVGGHEGHGELVVVFVVDGPEGVFFEVAVGPKPGEGYFAGFFVGVFALPVQS